MASGITIQINGLQPLIGKLERLGKTDANKSLRKGLRAGQKIITAAAKQSAPVKSGALRRAIKTRAMRRSRKAIGILTTLGSEGFFKGKTFYGAFQEFGWKTGTRKQKDQSTRRQIPGKHFLEKAAKSNGQRAGTVVIETTAREIERLARG